MNSASTALLWRGPRPRSRPCPTCAIAACARRPPGPRWPIAPNGPSECARSFRTKKRGRRELQRQPVHAIAQTRRLRPVGEHMSEMPAAARAQDFGALHQQAAIAAFDHRMRQRLPEARPAGAAIELGRRAEQGQHAAGADEPAAAMFVQQRTGEGMLGARLAQHGIALGPEQPPPFLGRMAHREPGRRSNGRGAEQSQPGNRRRASAEKCASIET